MKTNPAPSRHPTRSPRTLVFSVRSAVNQLMATPHYDFEDLICDWMDADLCAPNNRVSFIRDKISVAALKLLNSNTLAGSLISPSVGASRLTENYELLFAMLPIPHRMPMLSEFRNLRARCSKMVCYIPEVWSTLLRERPYLLRPLRDFDHIFVSNASLVEPIANLTRVRCTFLRLSVDAIKFSPFPFFPDRHVDVLNIGRRDVATHKALLKEMEDRGILYSFDTVLGSRFKDWRAHRTLYANMAKRAKYFVIHMGCFDEPHKTGGDEVIGCRFYEGAAAGAILIGDFPVNHETILRDFDWADAAIEADCIVETIGKLNAQPERMLQARCSSIRNSLLRHDHLYRWEEILGAVGFSPTTKMYARKARLAEMADETPGRLIEQSTMQRGARRAVRVGNSI